MPGGIDDLQSIFEIKVVATNISQALADINRAVASMPKGVTAQLGMTGTGQINQQLVGIEGISAARRRAVAATKDLSLAERNLAQASLYDAKAKATNALATQRLTRAYGLGQRDLAAFDSRIRQIGRNVQRAEAQFKQGAAGILALRQGAIDSATGVGKFRQEYEKAFGEKQQMRLRDTQHAWNTMRRTALDLGFVMQNLQITSGIALGAVAAGVTQITKNLVNATARMEDYRAQINTLAKGPMIGSAWMKQLQQFAVKSPLTFEETIRGAELLVGYGERFGRVIAQDTGLLAVMTKAAVFANVPLEQVVKSLEALKTGKNIRWARLTPLQITPQFVESLGIQLNKRGQLEGDPVQNFETIMRGLQQKLAQYHPEELLRTRLTNMEDVMFIFWASLGEKLKPATSRFLGELQDTLFKVIQTIDDPAVSQALGNAAENIIGPLGDKLIGFIESVSAAISRDPDLIPRWLNSIASSIKNLTAVFAGATAASGIAMVLRTVATTAAAGAELGGGPGAIAGVAIGTVIAILGTLGITAVSTRRKLDELLPPIQALGPAAQANIPQIQGVGIAFDDMGTGVKRTYGDIASAAEEAQQRQIDAARQAAAETFRVGNDSARGQVTGWQRAGENIAVAWRTWIGDASDLLSRAAPAWDTFARSFSAAWQGELRIISGIFETLGNAIAWATGLALNFENEIRKLLGMKPTAYNYAGSGAAPAHSRQDYLNRLGGISGGGGVGPLPSHTNDYVNRLSWEPGGANYNRYVKEPGGGGAKGPSPEDIRKGVTSAGVSILGDIPYQTAVALTGMTDKTCAATLEQYYRSLGLNPPALRTTDDVEKWLKSIGAKKVKAADLGPLDVGFAKKTGPLGMPAHVAAVLSNEGGIITVKDNQSNARKLGAGYFRYGYRIPTDVLQAGLSQFAGLPSMPPQFAALDTVTKALRDAGKDLPTLAERLDKLGQAVDRARQEFDQIAGSVLDLMGAQSAISQARYGLEAARARALGLDKTADIYDATGILQSLSDQRNAIAKFQGIYGADLSKSVTPGDFEGLARQLGIQGQLRQMQLGFAQTLGSGYDFAAGLRDKEGAGDLYKALLAQLDALKPYAEGQLGDAQLTAAQSLFSAGTNLSIAATRLSGAAQALATLAGIKLGADNLAPTLTGWQGLAGAGMTPTGAAYVNTLASQDFTYSPVADAISGGIIGTSRRLGLDPWGGSYVLKPGQACGAPGLPP